MVTCRQPERALSFRVFFADECLASQDRQSDALSATRIASLARNSKSTVTMGPRPVLGHLLWYVLFLHMPVRTEQYPSPKYGVCGLNGLHSDLPRCRARAGYL